MCTCALNDILRACFAKCSLCVARTSEFSHPPTPPKSVGWQVVSHARRLKTGTMRPIYRRLPMLAAKQGLCCRMFFLCIAVRACRLCVVGQPNYLRRESHSSPRLLQVYRAFYRHRHRSELGCTAPRNQFGELSCVPTLIESSAESSYCLPPGVVFRVCEHRAAGALVALGPRRWLQNGVLKKNRKLVDSLPCCTRVKAGTHVQKPSARTDMQNRTCNPFAPYQSTIIQHHRGCWYSPSQGQLRHNGT